MGQQAWRAYAEMALGMTDASRKKATKAVKKLLGRGGATAEQLQGLAEDLRQTSAANREALTKLIRVELDRALGRVGLATADEVADLTARVRELEDQLSQARAAAPAGVGAAGDGAPAGVTVTSRAEPVAELGDAVAAAVPSRPPRKVAKKTVPGRAEPAAPPAARAGGTAKGGTAAGGRAVGGTAAAGTAKKASPAKKTVTKKTVAKKAPAKRTAGQGGQP
jgi:polyhydroxyalkanoate synthesis regulator phasin